MIGLTSELLHQVLPDRPHPRSFAIDIHGYREEHASELNAANSKKRLLRTASFQPVGKE
jgi:hypothetical protein